MDRVDRYLAGRAALVTGAAHGIGRAASRALARRGALVALVDIDGQGLRAAVQEVEADGGRESALAICADASQRAQVQGAVADVVQRWGRLDILVNNAGICPLTSFAEIGEAEWDHVMAVNLKGPFLFCQAALSQIRATGPRGRIINISSAGGQMGGVAVGAHYAASKAGLIGLTKTLARLLAPDRATANCIAPATTATDLTAAWTEEVKAQVRASIPLGRFAEPEEIAHLVCYLASDEAAFITGATFDINGGLYLR